MKSSVFFSLDIATKVTPQKEEMLEKEGAFVNLKTKCACDHYWDKTIEKTILCILARVRFHTNQGQSRPNEASVFAFRFFSRSGPHLAEA